MRAQWGETVEVAQWGRGRREEKSKVVRVTAGGVWRPQALPDPQQMRASSLRWRGR